MAAGFVATLAMSLLLELLPFAGFPRIDVPALIVEPLLHRRPEPLTPWWWVGMGIHLFLGTVVFPVALLLAAGRLKRVRFLLLAWLMAMGLFLSGEGILTPLMGGGFFTISLPNWQWIVAADFLSHTLYGLLLGILGRPKDHA
jgi:hypothetical protein